MFVNFDSKVESGSFAIAVLHCLGCSLCCRNHFWNTRVSFFVDRSSCRDFSRIFPPTNNLIICCKFKFPVKMCRSYEFWWFLLLLLPFKFFCPIYTPKLSLRATATTISFELSLDFELDPRSCQERKIKWNIHTHTETEIYTRAHTETIKHARNSITPRSTHSHIV